MSELNPIPAMQGGQITSTHNIATINPRGNLYNDPQGLRGEPVESSVGRQQLEKAFYLKKVLRDTAPKRKFSRMASNISMPKNMGQKIKQAIEYPVLDDRNINDQGIDARGVQIRNGNLYGSSRDIGRIQGALPYLTEIGGRVNRIGFSRSETESTFNRFGIFYEYSDDAIQFDSDANLYQSMYRRALEAAEQITEDCLQADLLNSAGTVIYAGNATNHATMDETSVLTLGALSRLSRALDDNQTPRHTKYIAGSTNVDTRTATTYRTLFCGSEVVALLEAMQDQHGNPAFIPVHQYKAASGTIMEDEVGIIGKFRIVQVDKMLAWRGEGAVADPQFGLSTSNGKYDIFPLICLGDDAFSTISFNGSNGVNNNFQIIAKKPGEATASLIDPYGKIGFVSIQWWYGLLVQRPERIGIIKTVAPM